jgi:DNA-binding Lrp family transcriptional regulator
MSTTADLITALKKELKAAQMTYADLARALGLAESSVKRMLAKGRPAAVARGCHLPRAEDRLRRARAARGRRRSCWCAPSAC